MHSHHRHIIKVLPTKAEAIAFAAAHFAKAMQTSAHNPISVALSGGSTPKELYHHLVTKQSELSIPWEKIAFFWGDERLVPLDHPDSNFFMAKQTGILDLAAQSHPMWENEKTAGQLIDRYTHLLPKQLSYVMAGVGSDGHTLSIFPGSDLTSHERVVAIQDAQHPHPRLSISLDYANRAQHLVIYLFGAGKADIAYALLGPEPHPEFPAWHLGTPEKPALFILDQAAAQKL